MKKSIVILYFLFISIITYINILFGQASQVVYFLEAKQTEVINNTPALLSTVAIANTRGEVDAYVQNTPHLEVSVQDPTIFASIELYSMVQVKGELQEDYLAIYIKDIQIEDDLVLFDADEDVTILVDIYFNKEVSFTNSPKRLFQETAMTVYNPSNKLVLLPIGSLLTLFPTLQIESLEFSYRQQDLTTRPFLYLDSEALEGLTPTVMLLSNTIEDSYQGNPIVYYNQDLRKDFQGSIFLLYNHIIWQFIFVIPLTYFIFFHKDIRLKLKRDKLYKQSLNSTSLEKDTL
jgi:hypothetical protein